MRGLSCGIRSAVRAVAGVRHTSTVPPAAALKDLVSSRDPHTWDQAWQQGVTPWDCGSVSPPLRSLISTASVAPHVVGRSRALVPGCGSGYDCILLADAGFKITGIDISKTAIERAENLRKREPYLLKERTTFICGDFFEFTAEEKFNLIFDYTFFCALHPSMRQDWAKKMAELLAENGELITLMFPVDNTLPADEGPPYPVNPEIYKSVLEPAGLTLVSLKPCTTSLTPRLGREWLGRWVHAV